MNNTLREKKLARVKRVRANMVGSAQKPRLTVYRSNKYMYVQAIDDQAQKTVAAANTCQAKKAQTKTEQATVAAQAVASQLKSKKITALIFDRGSYKYHGRVKAVAEALRAEGLHV